eukprot:5794055-Amphidinium_carterae.1
MLCPSYMCAMAAMLCPHLESGGANAHGLPLPAMSCARSYLVSAATLRARLDWTRQSRILLRARDWQGLYTRTLALVAAPTACPPQFDQMDDAQQAASLLKFARKSNL